jgi:hypothetical protein
MYLQKKNVFKYINSLSRIHNTSLISAYFGLDSRECKYLEYLSLLLLLLLGVCGPRLV